MESEDLAPVRTDKEAKGGICIRPDDFTIKEIPKTIDELIEQDIIENRKKEAEKRDKNGEFLKGFEQEEPKVDTAFYESREVEENE